MKVIIDTNVLVSAALKNKDPEAVILFVASQPDIEWIVSAAIMAEYKEVLVVGGPCCCCFQHPAR